MNVREAIFPLAAFETILFAYSSKYEDEEIKPLPRKRQNPTNLPLVL